MVQNLIFTLNIKSFKYIKWYYKRVSQIMLRTQEGKYVLPKKLICDCSLDLIECLKQIKYQRLLLT